MKRLELIVLSLIFTTVVGGGVVGALYFKADQQRKLEIKIQEEVKGIDDMRKYPKVVNVPESNAIVGEVYTFTPIVSVTDGEYRVEVIKAPSWIYLYEGRLQGIPRVSDLGDTLVELRIWNGDVFTEFIYYISVYEKIIDSD